ncbi:MAG: DUF4293 family protein, partial [Bacteroidales bacterium]
MLQRIQTIYYFLAFVVAILMLFVPFIRFIDPDGQVYLLRARGIVSAETEPVELVLNTSPLLILLLLISLLVLTGIFLYRKRMLQIRLSIFSILLLLGSIGLIFFYRYYGIRHLSADSFLS